ncbi:toxin-antitoxin system YwqK family antitoxin [Flammeovirga aprica]|uniref:Uncharacterized protein n=1 Tax=Flammeovirga aprica JL-4 TaxID=694437 RepID=A0A7X9RZ23_9BACT|nr:hypothetical protein [Flammeovirga aprica]NME71333.1 hypothetical protein [Flammeovirga aprica JL-4]
MLLTAFNEKKYYFIFLFFFLSLEFTFSQTEVYHITPLSNRTHYSSSEGNLVLHDSIELDTLDIILGELDIAINSTSYSLSGMWTFYHRGLCEAEIDFIDDSLRYEKRYDIWGELEEEGLWNNGEKVGVWREYSLDKFTEYDYKNGDERVIEVKEFTLDSLQLTGFSYYDIVLEKTVVKDEWYYESGALKFRAEMDNQGELVGKKSFFYENGKVSYEGYYNEERTLFYDVNYNLNGQMTSKSIYDVLKKETDVRYYYPETGALKVKGQKKDWKDYGHWDVFDANGELLRTMVYENDSLKEINYDGEIFYKASKQPPFSCFISKKVKKIYHFRSMKILGSSINLYMITDKKDRVDSFFMEDRMFVLYNVFDLEDLENYSLSKDRLQVVASNQTITLKEVFPLNSYTLEIEWKGSRLHKISEYNVDGIEVYHVSFSPKRKIEVEFNLDFHPIVWIDHSIFEDFIYRPNIYQLIVIEELLSEEEIKYLRENIFSDPELVKMFNDHFHMRWFKVYPKDKKELLRVPIQIVNNEISEMFDFKSESFKGDIENIIKKKLNN